MAAQLALTAGILSVDKPKMDEVGMGMAKHVSRYSEDPSTKVGAAILRPDGTLASVGWNGLPRRVKAGNLNDREWKYPRMVHAELNAVLNAREPLTGYTLYVYPLHPCSLCGGAIIQAGITRVVAVRGGEWGSSDIALELFADATICFDEMGEIR